MANYKQSYVIKIQYDTPDGSSIGEAPERSLESGKNKADAKGVPQITPAAVVKPFVSTALQMETQRISTLTGSGQLARRQSLINSVVQSSTDVATKALGGATIASTLGFAAGPAAAVAVAMTAVEKVMQIATNIADLNNKRQVENTAITATKARAGLSWGRSR